MAAHMKLHHCKIFTKNGWKFTQKMVNNLQFQLFAFKKLKNCNHWVLRNGTALFVVTEHRKADDECCSPRYHRCFHDDSTPDRLGLHSRGTRPRLMSTYGFANHIDQLIKKQKGCRNFLNADTSKENWLNYSNIVGLKKQLCNNMDFTKLGQGGKQKIRGKGPNQGSARHLLCGNRREIQSVTVENIQNDDSIYYIGNKDIDSVYDVAFHVEDVEQSFEKAVRGGAEPIDKPRTMEDSQGKVSVATVRSCVGDVIHTLLNTKDYNGVFLPGFSEYSHQSNERGNEDVQVNFDHVTYVCPMGDSERVLNWYEKCFGMKRLKINSDEDDDEGFVVRGNDVGMRLKAMEYWRCSETHFAATDCSIDQPTNFVVAEALPGQGRNQIETFLREHNGPGVQHIGLHTKDLVHTASSLRQSGLEFIRPPKAYYTEVGKLDEILEVGEEVRTLEEHGILLDTEADAAIKPLEEEINANQRYLMQVFTKPLFSEDTFFLEYIQRCGATGFGAGNITALWRAVQQYIDPRPAAVEQCILPPPVDEH